MTENKPEQKQKRFKIRRKRDACQPVAVSGINAKRKSQPVAFNEKVLKGEILREARVLGIPDGTAEAIAERITEKVREWVTKRGVVTMDDVNRRVVTEAEKYSADLAYVYQNRGKII